MKRAAVCIGMFDGVHRGHARIIDATIREARRLHLESVGVTFDPHPARILRPSHMPPRLQALEQRIWHMRRLGLDRCLVIRFTRAFSRMEAPAFVTRFLSGHLKAKAICVGSDFRFGKGAKGGPELLRALARKLGYRVSVIAPVRSGRDVISSTRIRRLVISGHLAEAAALLGRPAGLYGRVVRGRGRGRKMGFPTVNLKPLQDVLPPKGVYAIRMRDGERFYDGVLHIGPRPTFKERTPTIEAYLFNFHKSMYNKKLEVFMHGKIRATRTFSSLKSLQKQIQKDVSRAKSILKGITR